MFAKLYPAEELGQVLVKIDANEKGGIEVRYFFEPKGLGVCSVALEFIDDEDGSAWDKAEAAFNNVDEESAVQFVKKIAQHIFAE